MSDPSWLEEPDTFCTLVPEHALQPEETVDGALVRLFAPVAKKDERNEVLPLEDPRYLEAVDRTLAGLIEHAPADGPKPELADRERGVFVFGPRRYHLRVTFLRRK